MEWTREWTREEDDILLENRWISSISPDSLLILLPNRSLNQCLRRLEELTNGRDDSSTILRNGRDDSSTRVSKSESIMGKIRISLNNDESYQSFQDLFRRFLKSQASVGLLMEKIQQLQLNEFGRELADSISQKNKHKKTELVKGLKRLKKANQEAELQRELERAKLSIKELVFKDREGEQIDRIQLISQIRVFSKYKGRRELESFMLEDATTYYAGKAASCINEYTVPDYMIMSETCLKKEKERTPQYLPNLKLVKEVENQLLVVVGKQLLENEHSGCRALLRDGKFDDLNRMYRLYDPILHGLEPVAELFKQHVTAEGNALINQGAKAATDQVLIRQLIELRKKYMDYVLHLFQNHTLFHKALKEAFEIFWGKEVAGVSSAEILATFCHNILKKGGESEKLSDEAVQETFENVINMLSYIHDKKLFKKCYRKKLAHRYLFGLSGSDAQESELITKFKELLGWQFTYKMERMVIDMTISKETKVLFKDYQSITCASNPGLDLTVNVLRSGIWPSYERFAINLPNEMVRIVEMFESFYPTVHDRKKLSWIYNMGTCEVIGNFEPNSFELVVSTCQAALLMLFNHTPRISFTEILQQLGVDHDVLVKLLQSLSSPPECNLLVKEPPSTVDISETDTFIFNEKFRSKTKRIKFPVPLMANEKNTVVVHERDRKTETEAAIVRIMKEKKVMTYEDLVSDCVEELAGSFKPDREIMKKAIEHLVSTGYLERDSDNPNSFKYLP